MWMLNPHRKNISKLHRHGNHGAILTITRIMPIIDIYIYTIYTYIVIYIFLYINIIIYIYFLCVLYMLYVCYIYILFLFLLHDVALLFHFFFKGLVSLWLVICRAQGPRRGLWLSSPTCRSGIRTSRNGSPWSGRRWATAGTFFFGSGPNIIDPWLIWGTPWFKKPARLEPTRIQ